MDAEDRRERLKSARIYWITGAAGLKALAEVLDAGVDVVQLREKHMEGGPLLEVALGFRKVTDEAGALFIVNDRVDVALASGADGVHLGQDDLPVPVARDQMGEGPIIGLSTHSEGEVDRAQGSGADYIGVGPVHPTPTKPGRPGVGAELVRYAAEHSELAFFAIGGLDASNIGEALAAGAERVAVLRAISEAPDLAEATRKLKALLGAP